ncbi:hypothetical protein TWF225_001624 [Orbilia oligospora]|nr:hypothetical protein TWF225_001624 [Orbilia oligospora]KAF3272532.1 hypothetical protein TWF217_000024 [Orbilia oligospora]
MPKRQVAVQANEALVLVLPSRSSAKIICNPVQLDTNGILRGSVGSPNDTPRLWISMSSILILFERKKKKDTLFFPSSTDNIDARNPQKNPPLAANYPELPPKFNATDSLGNSVFDKETGKKKKKTWNQVKRN